MPFSVRLKHPVSDLGSLTGSLCAKSFAVKRNPKRASPVFSLFWKWNPEAVCFLVISVYISPLDGIAGGTHTHIRDKSIEAPHPSITDSDPSTTVVLETFSSLIPASTLETIPNSVSQRELRNIAFVVLYKRTPHPQTPTAFGHAFIEVWKEVWFLRSTLAPSNNIRPAFFFCSGYHSDFMKNHPDRIDGLNSVFSSSSLSRHNL